MTQETQAGSVGPEHKATWVRELWLAATAGLGLALIGGVSLPERAEAKRAQSKKSQKKVSARLDGLSWGDSPKRVATYWGDRLKRRYLARMTKTLDIIEQERLQHELNAKLRKLRSGYVRFNNQPTGWDNSFIRDEYTHGNGESMYVVKDGKTKHFYFFMRGELWKHYEALDSAIADSGSYKEVAAALSKTYGSAKKAKGKLHSAASDRSWYRWADGKSRMRLMDEREFYGFYGLVLEDRNTTKRLASLRKNAPRARARAKSQVVEVATGSSAEGADEHGDTAPNIVDQLTGRRGDRLVVDHQHNHY